MQPRITMLTIGVDDLERSVRFYVSDISTPRSLPC
jgi:catechol 2,3-dioxygenase-like lactoylglutathione lyase family enzyme